MSFLSVVSSDSFHSIFFGCLTALSLFTNSLLISVVLLSKADHLGSYRYLIIVFSICDLLTSITHQVIQPLVYMTREGFFFYPRFSNTFRSENGSIGTFGSLCFIGSFYQTFIVLAFHFVYRLKVVSSDDLRFTNSWGIRQWISAAASINLLYTSLMVYMCYLGFIASNYTRQFVTEEVAAFSGSVNLSDPQLGYLVVIYRPIDAATGVQGWNIRVCSCMVVCYFLFGGTATVILICIYKIRNTLNKTRGLAAKTIRMQKQLFKALLIQTLVPCIFSYLPLSGMLLMPASGVALGTIGNPLIMTTAIFPAIDAIFVIGYVKRFRETLLAWLRSPLSLPLGVSSVSASTSTRQRSNASQARTQT